MLRAFMLSLLLPAVVCVSLAADGGPTIAVNLPDGTRFDLTESSLRTLPRISVVAEFHGKSQEFQGVDLLAALKLAGLEPTTSLRGAALSLIVVAEGADGYRAAFSLAELDPTIGAKQVLLADSADGLPLPDGNGPWRLVVASDKRAARWVWSLVRIEVLHERGNSPQL